MQQRNYWILGAAVLIIILGLVFLMHPRMAAPANTTASTTPIDLGNGITVNVPKGVTITPVNDTSTPAIQPPSLTGAITFGPGLSADQEASLRSEEASVITLLKANPVRVDLWLELGVDRKDAGDYAGAAQAFQYVAATGPASINYIADADLGDLYLNFDKNYPQAETYYLKAVALRPDVVDYYRELYTLYRYDYKVGTGADIAILERGLKNNPGNPDLTELLKEAQQ